MSARPQAVNEPVARKAIRYLKDHASAWLARVTVPEGRRVRHRFWQPGGGYDRDITSIEALRAMMDLHARQSGSSGAGGQSGGSEMVDRWRVRRTEAGEAGN